MGRRDRSRSREQRAAAAAPASSGPSRPRQVAPSHVTPALPSAPPGGGGVPDWLKDLVGPGGGPAAAPVQTASEGPVTAKPLEIPLSLGRILTVDGGATIRRIEQSSGAQIALREELQHLGYVLLFITGNERTSAAAKETRPECRQSVYVQSPY